jgi:glucosyl-dolichyl phosphate glucuronosyltransferase
LLVVNNNSTDNTDQIIAHHAEWLPIRRLFEPKAGKSHAANLGIQHATGELIICTDDDVLVASRLAVGVPCGSTAMAYFRSLR